MKSLDPPRHPTPDTQPPVLDGAEATRGRLLRATASVAGMRLFAMMLTYPTNMALTHGMGAARYGNYAYALSWLSLLSVLGLVGIDRLVVRNAAVYQVQQAWGLLAGQVRWANGVALGAALGVLGMAAALWPLLPTHVTAALITALPLAALLLPLLVLIRIQQATLRGLGQVVTSQAPELTVIPALQLLGVLLIGASSAWALTTSQVFGIYVGAAVFALALAARWVYRALPAEARAATPVYQSQIWITSTLPLLLVSAILAANGRMDVLMLGALQDAPTVGRYVVADQVTGLIAFSLEASGVVLGPTIARMYAVGEQARLQRLITKSTRGILLGATLMTALLMAAGAPLLGLYGAAFANNQDVLLMLSAGQWFAAAFGPVALLLVMTGHERDVTVGTAIGVAVNVVLNLWLIPRWGAAGAAVAVSCSLVQRNALLAWFAWRRLGLRTGPL